MTALGNRWRDEIEATLSTSQVKIKARRDIGFIIDVHTANVCQTFNLPKELLSGWGKSVAQVSGNLFWKSVEVIVDSSASENKPNLSASLNQANPCYPAGGVGSKQVLDYWVGPECGE